MLSNRRNSCANSNCRLGIDLIVALANLAENQLLRGGLLLKTRRYWDRSTCKTKKLKKTFFFFENELIEVENSDFFAILLEIFDFIKGMFKTQAFSKSLCFEHSLYNRPKIFKSWFFGTSTSKKYFLSELKKVLGHSFDVEFCVLSIYEVFRAIPALSQVPPHFE